MADVLDIINSLDTPRDMLDSLIDNVVEPPNRKLYVIPTGKGAVAGKVYHHSLRVCYVLTWIDYVQETSDGDQAAWFTIPLQLL